MKKNSKRRKFPTFCRRQNVGLKTRRVFNPYRRNFDVLSNK